MSKAIKKVMVGKRLTNSNRDDIVREIIRHKFSLDIEKSSERFRSAFHRYLEKMVKEDWGMPATVLAKLKKCEALDCRLSRPIFYDPKNPEDSCAWVESPVKVWIPYKLPSLTSVYHSNFRVAWTDELKAMALELKEEVGKKEAAYQDLNATLSGYNSAKQLTLMFPEMDKYIVIRADESVPVSMDTIKSVKSLLKD